MRFPPPPRRWFQFRLSTWFVLVAILAWAIVLRPWVTCKRGLDLVEAWTDAPVQVSTRQGFTLGIAWNAALPDEPRDSIVVVSEAVYGLPRETHWVRIATSPARILPPVLALFALLGWKVVSAIVECRRRNTTNALVKAEKENQTRYRWFRFRLRTWFVLVPLLSSAMLMRPSLDFGVVTPLFPLFASPTVAVSIFVDHPMWELRNNGGDSADNVCLLANTNWRTRNRVCWIAMFPKNSSWPILALAAFLAWKAAWAIGPRMVRRRRSAASE